MIEFVPTDFYTPPLLLGDDVPSAWKDIVPGLKYIFDRFKVKRNLALEFGVEWGFSTVALSNFFDRVFGVDTFLGDQHSGTHESWYEDTRKRLEPYKNIRLINKSWQDFTETYESLALLSPSRPPIDFIHVDIEHTYEQTYGCGEWAVQHSPVVAFHDTWSFRPVMKACEDLARENGLQFYDWYEGAAGFGILVKE